MTDDNTNNQTESSRKKALLNQKSWLDYLWIIREHWLLGLLVGACAAAYFAFSKEQEIPLYRSVAVLIFEAQRDRVINIQEVVDTSLGRGGELLLRSHMTDLRSNSFRRQVVETLSPEEIELLVRDYRTETNTDPSVHGIIAGANKIRLIGGNIFNFEFHHRNPQAAALLANRFSEVFNDFIMERARRSNEAALRFLRSQSEELKLRVERSELAVQRYRQERNLVSLEESQNLIVERMKSLSGSLNQARLELLNISTTIQSIREAGDDMDALARNPTLNSMGSFPEKFTSRIQLLADRRALALRYGSRHPRMIENAAAIESIEADIEESLRKNISDLNERYRITQARVENLQTALAEAEQESLNLDQIAIEYNVLRRKLETDKALFTQVHQRLNEAMLASQLTDTPLRVVDAAWPAGSPFFPDTGKTATMAGVIFLLGFAGTPYLVYFLNLNLKTATDIEQHLGIPFLGEIRRFPKKFKDLHHIVLKQSDPEACELFRQIHSQILLRNKKLDKGHTFIVTSAIPREGKSFFAINLAASFSRHHYKTLLMDCDFRRPVVGERLSLSGNAATVADTHAQPQVVSDTLHVLPASQTTLEATELIESAAFRENLDRCRQNYDVIVVDTPPSGLFPDAAIIGDKDDQIIFLTQLNKHRKATLSGILQRLEQSNSSMLGVVVNRVAKRHARNLGAYSYSGYGKYKNYYPTPKSAKANEPVT
jgi:capsular exopolysaccharide synthesis family protein